MSDEGIEETAQRGGWRDLPWWGKAAWVLLVICVVGVATGPNAATAVVGLTALVGVIASFGVFTRPKAQPAPAASADAPARAALPGWGYIGWALVVIAVLGTIGAAVSTSSVTTLSGDKEPFTMPPIAIVLGVVGLVLGVAGLVVRELKTRD